MASRLYDGLNDRLEGGNILDFERTDPFGILYWVRTGDTLQDKFPVAKEENSGNFRGYDAIIRNGDGVPIFSLGHTPADNTGLIGSISVHDDIWHHVAGTHKGTALGVDTKIYVDGLQDPAVGSGSVSGTIKQSASLNVGSRDLGGVPHLGKIGPVHIVSKELNQDEILEFLFNPNYFIPELELYLPNYGVDSPELDLSGNGRNFTVNGPVISFDGPPV